MVKKVMAEEEFIDIGDVSEGEWFPFQRSKVDYEIGKIQWDDPVMVNGKPIAEMCVRLMNPFYEERITKRPRITTHVFNPKTRAMDAVTTFKELSAEEIKQERDASVDYAIVDFRGFRNEKTKKPIECTKENKIAIMRQPVIDRFFNYCQERLGQSGVKQREEEAENFTHGSSGQTNISQE